MKPKLAWLTLPLALCALVWGVKWRVDHPTPTQTDLEIRALMSQSSKVEVFYSGRKKPMQRFSWLSPQEMEPFVNCFYLSPRTSKTSSLTMGANGIVSVFYILAKPRKDGVVGVIVTISLDKRDGKVVIGHPDNNGGLDLHPVTATRWSELLFSHLRIGPELESQMKR